MDYAIQSNQAFALGTTVKSSPRKLNIVAGLIRGKKVEQALAELKFCEKRVAGEVTKVLLSAIANAQNNFDLDVDSLYVDEASVGKGIFLKRMHARAKGRGCRIVKKMSRIRIIVGEKK